MQRSEPGQRARVQVCTQPQHVNHPCLAAASRCEHQRREQCVLVPALSASEWARYAVVAATVPHAGHGGAITLRVQWMPHTLLAVLYRDTSHPGSALQLPLRVLRVHRALQPAHPPETGLLASRHTVGCAAAHEDRVLRTVDICAAGRHSVALITAAGTLACGHNVLVSPITMPQGAGWRGLHHHQGLSIHHTGASGTWRHRHKAPRRG